MRQWQTGASTIDTRHRVTAAHFSQRPVAPDSDRHPADPPEPIRPDTVTSQTHKEILDGSIFR